MDALKSCGVFVSEKTITLPWPDKALSPNSRKDRRHTGDIRRKYKEDAQKATWAAGFRKVNWPRAHALITFHPPDLRRRDLDNMLGSIKYGLDGIAATIGVDDADWEISLRRGEKVKNGAVCVEFGPPLEATFVAYRGQIS